MKLGFGLGFGVWGLGFGVWGLGFGEPGHCCLKEGCHHLFGKLPDLSPFGGRGFALLEVPAAERQGQHAGYQDGLLYPRIP